MALRSQRLGAERRARDERATLLRRVEWNREEWLDRMGERNETIVIDGLTGASSDQT